MMELDELINILQRRIDRINKVGERTGESYWQSEVDILKLLKDLKVYKKALEMACDILGDMDDSNSDSEEWNEWLLQKSREEE